MYQVKINVKDIFGSALAIEPLSKITGLRSLTIEFSSGGITQCHSLHTCLWLCPWNSLLWPGWYRGSDFTQESRDPQQTGFQSECEVNTEDSERKMSCYNFSVELKFEQRKFILWLMSLHLLPSKVACSCSIEACPMTLVKRSSRLDLYEW